MFNIEDQVIAVAGAAGAFGSCIARELAVRGCQLSVFDIDGGSLDSLEKELPVESVQAIRFDATDENSCHSAISQCVQKWGRIDGLINSVGAFEIMPSTQMPAAVFRELLETNVGAAFNLCRNAARFMIPNQSGRIINIASVSDSVANPGYAAYASSKAALSQLTRVLALELAEHSITVNAISPAIAQTNLTADYLSQKNNLDYAVSKIPMRRLFQPSDILGTVILLLSQGGEFITGQSIHIDGGRTIS